jgi:hypothetical protein
MNHASGSALQKVSFVLVLFIAAAAGYLVVRERIRADAERQRALNAALAAAKESELSTEPVGDSSNRSPNKVNYAPLRPRVETNVVRVLSNRFIAVPGAVSNKLVAVDRTAAQGVVNVTPGVVLQTPVLVGGGGGSRGAFGLTISGRVLLRGTPPPEKAVTLDAACGRLHPAPMKTRHYVVGPGSTLADVFVYVKQGAAPQSAPPPLTSPLLDQVNCEYVPYVIGVQAGQKFKVRNSDPLLHNVHSIPTIPGNKERNVGQSVKGITHDFIFEKPEVFVQFKCDVHPWMFAYVGVVEHRWFAVSDGNGNFTLPPGLPHGQYTLAAVHRKAGESTQQITVSANESEPVTFTLEVPTL